MPSEGPACTCGSHAVIDTTRHAEDCHRRQWREAIDDRDALLKAIEEVVVRTSAARTHLAIDRHGYLEVERRTQWGTPRHRGCQACLALIDLDRALTTYTSATQESRAITGTKRKKSTPPNTVALPSVDALLGYTEEDADHAE